jgi:uncharacterized protein with HEPN domain
MEQMMSYDEELIFGLKRWVRKAIDYYGGRSVEDFLRDEKSFDAASFCIYTISEIGTKLAVLPHIIEKYKEISFKGISELYGKCFPKDNINVSLMMTVLEEDFPKLLLVLEA